MTVSIIVVNWNSGNLLFRCLEALEKQTIQPNRIYVVDNASTDNSTLNVEHFMGVKLLKMPSNLGFAGGNNAALAQCDTEFVALLNPDAFPVPDWLENLLKSAQSHPESAAFGSRQIRDGQTEVLDGIGDSYYISGRVCRKRYGRKVRREDLVLQRIFSPCAAAALYRTKAIIDVGGFDEDFFCYIEDVDLGFRLRLAGYQAIYVPDAVVHHIGSATTGGQHSDFAVYFGHRNLVWTYVKNMPGVLFWLLLPLHLLLNLFSVILFAARGRGSLIVQAKFDALAGLPRMWRKRKQIQKERIVSASAIWKHLNIGL